MSILKIFLRQWEHFALFRRLLSVSFEVFVVVKAQLNIAVNSKQLQQFFHREFYYKELRVRGNQAKHKTHLQPISCYLGFPGWQGCGDTTIHGTGFKPILFESPKDTEPQLTSGFHNTFHLLFPTLKLVRLISVTIQVGFCLKT